jgi:hypothetical protein
MSIWCRGPKGKVPVVRYAPKADVASLIRIRALTSKSAEKKDVDARPKAGHDEQELF